MNTSHARAASPTHTTLLTRATNTTTALDCVHTHRRESSPRECQSLVSHGVANAPGYQPTLKYAKLTADEKRRNGHGSPALFVGEGNPLFKPMAACYGDEPCELLTLTPELFPDAASALSIAGTLTPL